MGLAKRMPELFLSKNILHYTILLNTALRLTFSRFQFFVDSPKIASSQQLCYSYRRHVDFPSS